MGTVALRSKLAASTFRSLHLSVQPPRGRGLGQGNAKQFIAVISFICICSLRAATAAEARPRQLEDEWNGEWDGQWTANEEDDYVYDCDENCQENKASGKKNDDDMWYASDELALTPDQIITYVTLGILGFMTLLCCVCYPEILVVPCGKLCGYCCGAGGEGVNSIGGLEEGADMDSDYVGGKQRTDTKKRRKSKSSSRTKSSRGVELV